MLAHKRNPAALLGGLTASLVLPEQFGVAPVAEGFVVLGVESNRRGLLLRLKTGVIFGASCWFSGGCAIGLLNRRVDMRTSHFANLALILALVPLIRRLCPAVYGVKLQPHVPSAAKSPRNQ